MNYVTFISQSLELGVGLFHPGLYSFSIFLLGDRRGARPASLSGEKESGSVSPDCQTLLEEEEASSVRQGEQGHVSRT